MLDFLLASNSTYGFPNSPWHAVRSIAQRASERNWSVFLIGGALRDLTLSGISSRPRDFDLVFCELDRRALATQFSYMSRPRTTNLGGLRYNYDGVILDIWPLNETFEVKHRDRVQIDDVPKHAFLDIEAIAIEISPCAGKTRQIVEHGFTKAILSKTIDINYEPNPFPEVCLIKAIRMAISLKLLIGHDLMDYILKQRWDLNALMEAQHTHYGRAIFDKPELERVLELMAGWNRKEGNIDLTSLHHFALKDSDYSP
jgi:hypothetical protein